MASITVDALQVLITANSKDLDEKLAKISQNMGGMSGDTSKATSSMSAALQKVGGVGVKALQVGVVGAIAAVTASIPGAVKRIDTLVAFPRVLEAMGASSVQAAKATDTLAKRLSGLPTPLQEGAAGVQALVSAGLGVEEATDVFLAFNNATLAASTEAGAAQGAFTQLVQSISKGKIEGQEWNSIVAAMPTAFQALSKESGLTREELRELYRTDPQKLLDDLTKLDKEGGGGLASLDEQARAATGGIGTSFSNMRNAIVRGIEGIVAKLGDGSLEEGQKKISDMITKIGKAFEKALDFIGKVVAYIMDNKDIFGALAVGIGVLVGAITAATIAMGIFSAVMAINPIALIVMAVAALVSGLIYFFTQTETGKAIWQGFMDFMGVVWSAITGFFTGAWEIISGIWSGVTGFFTGIWEGIKNIFNGVVNWIKEWGITILAVIFWPFSLLLGLIIDNWDAIKSVFTAAMDWLKNLFTAIWDFIVAVFSPIVEFYISIFKAAWDGVKAIWSVVTTFFKGVWDGIVKVFSVVGSWFKGIFDTAWSNIKRVFSPVGDFFRGVWDTIVSIFGKVGTSIGNAIGGAVKGVVNAILGFAEGQINGFIRAINVAIGIINKIPGVKIGYISELKIPRLATGGITTGSTIANIGEAGREAVLPLDRNTEWMDDLAAKIDGDGQHITINVGGERLVDTVIQGINGRSFLGGSSVINV